LCDIGASELLINEDELVRALKEYGINNEGLKAIYDKFMVSYDVLFLKLSEFLDANILIWRNHARHELEKKNTGYIDIFLNIKIQIRLHGYQMAAQKNT